MSSANENTDNGADPPNNTSTSNIFGSSTKSSISSLFGSASSQPSAELPEDSGGAGEAPKQASQTSSLSSARGGGNTDADGGDAYDLFGTTHATSTSYYGSKNEAEAKTLLPAAAMPPAPSLFAPAQKSDPSSLFSKGDDGKSGGLLGSSGVFAGTDYDPSKTSNVFGDTHLARAAQPAAPPSPREPPILHKPQEKPKEPKPLDLSTVRDDYGGGYDSNLYAFDGGDDAAKAKTTKPAATSLFETTPAEPEKVDLFGPPSKPVAAPEPLGAAEAKPLFTGQAGTTGMFGSLGSGTLTFNLVENDQTNKVSESSLTSKTASLTEAGDQKGSLFETSETPKSGLFEELTKAPLSAPEAPKPATSESFGLFAEKAKTTDLFGVAKEVKSAAPQAKADGFGTGAATSTGLFRTSSGSSVHGAQTETQAPAASTGLFGEKKGSGSNLFAVAGTEKPSTTFFGTSDKPGGGIFGRTGSGSNLFGTTTQEKPTTSLFAPAQKSLTTNLFGTTDTAATPAPAASVSFATTATADKTASSLFGTTTADKPASTLFGTSTAEKPTSDLFTTTTTEKPTTSLFQTATATTEKPISAFGTTTTATEKPATGLFATTETAKSNLFAKTDAPTSGPLFGTAEPKAAEPAAKAVPAPTEAPATNLFATPATEPAKTTPAVTTAEPAKTTPVFGTTETPKAPDLLAPAETAPAKECKLELTRSAAPKVTFAVPPQEIAGTSATTTTPAPAAPATQTSLTPAATTTQEPPKLDMDFSVTEQHTIADLLDTWEKRIAKKVEDFNLFADKVANIDRHIVQQCSNINKMLNMHRELLEKHRKMEASINTMEEEQKMALSVLDNMETVLKGRLESLNNRSNGYNMVQAITRNLQELTDQLTKTTKVAEDTAATCQPEPLYSIAKVLSFHQVSIIDLEKQCDEIDSRIKALELM